MNASASLLLDRERYEPSSEFRLPLSWSQKRAEQLLEAVDPHRRTGVLLLDPWNIVTFTGLWALTTERLLAAYLPPDGGAPIWFAPWLDRELVASWWCAEVDSYFDVPIADGQMPPLGVAGIAETVDQYRWLFERLRHRGVQPSDQRGSRGFVIDVELAEGAAALSRQVFGRAPESVAGVALGFRQRKTDEELALWARAYDYFDAVHVEARDRLLRGVEPGLTDSRLRLELAGFALDRIMKDYGPDRSLHGPVGITVDLSWVRAGAVTGFPHPNQVRHAVISEQRTIQVSGIVQIGGCGGELYRPYMLQAPTPHERMLWIGARDGCLVLKDALRAGRTGGEAAADVHRFQAAQGVAGFAATRPSHGQGMEGHQSPYISLGERTVLEPGMCFSVEPGLYDSAGGFGVNFSDTFVVQERGPAVQLSRLPWTEEWCWL